MQHIFFLERANDPVPVDTNQALQLSRFFMHFTCFFSAVKKQSLIGTSNSILLWQAFKNKLDLHNGISIKSNSS